MLHTVGSFHEYTHFWKNFGTITQCKTWHYSTKLSFTSVFFKSVLTEICVRLPVRRKTGKRAESSLCQSVPSPGQPVANGQERVGTRAALD